MSIKTFPINSLALRGVLIIPLLLCLFLSYTALKWSFGNTLAKQVEAKEIAEIAVQLAPNDPQSYFALGVQNEKSFLPENFAKALENYEKAVSVSPYDFRLWLALGKARERAGETKSAEKALRRALELAPNYAEPHWILGNHLLRQGNAEEAFLEIRKAVEQDEKFANPAVVTAWQIFDGDLMQISQKIGDSAPIKAQLAPFLAQQKRFDDALTFWNSIPNEEKITTYKKKGEELIGKFVEAKSFRNALTLQSQIATAEDEKFVISSIFNGDFEKEVKIANVGLFDWKISEGAQPQISLDGSQKHGGSRSLILLFNSDTGKELRSIQQTVVVESGKTYKLEGFYRADLKTIATLKWEILDATDNKVLASSNDFTNSADWTALSTEFTTLPTTQAVIIRLGNVTCKQGICPISGKLWFDDFSLK